ncbi:MAG TPA: endonuclease MutS2 [Cytophagales bacterium]|nr:endonuclease MutS2 [Cytophagales bacterium]
MLYPNNFEEKIGFDKIKELLIKECSGILGVLYVNKVRFSSNHEQVGKWLAQTDEFRQIIQSNYLFPSSGFIDLTEEIAKASVQGTFLSEEEFFNVKIVLTTLLNTTKFFQVKYPGQFPNLLELASGITVNERLNKSIDEIIDERGKVKDHASPELLRIRRQIISQNQLIRKKLDHFLREYKSSGFSESDASPTIRNGRMVIPVSAEYKRRVKGFIHDESATGQTVFIEPADLLEINNEVKELEYQERREVIRILTHLTDQLRPEIPEVKKGLNFLSIIDFVRAKARLAIKLSAVLPVLEKGHLLEWNKARHPLLVFSFQKSGKTVIPLDIKMNHEQRILIISGPNAGGKSATLKTVGLLQYMLQCGLLIPVQEGSKTGVFKNIFIDIGDEQSLENDLSTYSSHLTNMHHFLKFADRNTLLLIDEFGTGTEPQYGAAVAEAILEELNIKESFGIITTHYSNIKLFADRNRGVINAAMLFDGERLEPTYKLAIGKPGSSFALEIASKIGLPRPLIEKAKQKVGEKQVNLDELLKSAEQEKIKFTEQNLELKKKDLQLKSLISEYNEQREIIEGKKKEILNDAKLKAKDIVREANQKIENAVREIKENKADKERTKEIRKEIAILSESLKPEVKKEEKSDEILVVGGEIGVGDLVRVKNSGAVAKVLSMKGKDVEVAIGELKSNVKLSRLEKISKKAYKEQMNEEDRKSPTGGININQRMADFTFNLDLRGKRHHEVIPMLDEFIDQAILVGSPELRIIHGKGDGILRKAVREHLRKYKEVDQISDDHADRGGAGVSIVKMK